VVLVAGRAAAAWKGWRCQVTATARNGRAKVAAVASKTVKAGRCRSPFEAMASLISGYRTARGCTTGTRWRRRQQCDVSQSVGGINWQYGEHHPARAENTSGPTGRSLKAEILSKLPQ